MSTSISVMPMKPFFVDPQLRPVVIIIFTHVLLSKILQNKTMFQMEIKFATIITMDLAEGILDNSCLACPTSISIMANGVFLILTCEFCGEGK